MEAIRVTLKRMASLFSFIDMNFADESSSTGKLVTSVLRKHETFLYEKQYKVL